MPKGPYLGGGPKGKKGFPVGDAKHARLAIGGATRSEHAGNISHATADRIRSEARARLHGLQRDPHKEHSRSGR